MTAIVRVGWDRMEYSTPEGKNSKELETDQRSEFMVNFRYWASICEEDILKMNID